MERYNNELAAEEAEVVKGIAKREAGTKDMMGKPLASHYDYASKFVDGLAVGWGGVLDKKQADLVHQEAINFSGEELDLFMTVVSEAAEDIVWSRPEVKQMLSELSNSSELTAAAKKDKFEAYVRELYSSQESYIRDECMENAIFKKKPQEFQALLHAFLQNRPIVSIPIGYREMVKSWYTDK